MFSSISFDFVARKEIFEEGDEQDGSVVKEFQALNVCLWEQIFFWMYCFVLHSYSLLLLADSFCKVRRLTTFLHNCRKCTNSLTAQNIEGTYML
jgi:hypothetical protein